jgi:hypothetical protein
MNILLTQTILAARNSEGDDTFWMQILVVVILAGAFGIFSLAKARANKFKRNDRQFSEHHRHRQNHSAQFAARKELLSAAPIAVSNIDENKKLVEKAFKKPIVERERDLHSGMEILEPDFLLKVVENTNDGSDEKDVAMRKLNFKELLRRGELSQIDSHALKIYAINKGNVYGKDIQCEAIKTLAERTAKGEN